MKRSRLKPMSDKRRKRAAEVEQFRLDLKQEVGCCELCDPEHRKRWKVSALQVHEIARGSCRQEALDKRFAVLVLCPACHLHTLHAESWPEERQLAVLKRSRPADFDLLAYSKLKGFGPNRIAPEDVKEWE